MSGDFFDSNILIYLFDDIDTDKREQSLELVQQALQTQDAHISFQVVQEVLNGISRKIERPARPELSRRLLDSVLMPMWSVMPSLHLYSRTLDLQQRYQYSFYDSLIIAAALEVGCSRLLSEDLQHGQVIESLRIENPFHTAETV